MPAFPASDRDDAGFGLWVRQRRQALLLTQEELAERAQIAVRTVRNIESGRTSGPRARTRLLIAKALETASSPNAVDDAVRPQPGDVATTRIPAQLPPDLLSFVGRAGHLRELDGLLGPNPFAAVCVISGMPGVGKTTLAVRWAHRVRPDFPDGQLYANLGGFDASEARNPSDVLRGLLDAFGEDHGQVVSTSDLTGLLRSRVAGRRLLLLLDNARDADQVRPLLPAAPGCVTVVTSRNQLTGLVAIDGARPMVLKPCSPQEGRDLLAARIGVRRVHEEPMATDRIVQRCGRLPLALALVGARAALGPRFALSALAEELDAELVLDAFDDGAPMGDVATALSWSYCRLTEPAARMLRMFGQLPSGATGVEAAASAAGWPVRQARRVLAELTCANLVEEEGPGRFAVHDLVRAYAQGRTPEIDTPVEQCQVRARTVYHYLRTAQVAAALLRPHRPTGPNETPVPGAQPVDLADDGEAVAWFAAERRALHVLIATAARHGTDVTAWRLSQAMAAFLERSARWAELATVGRVAVAATVRLGDAVGLLEALSMLGRAQMRLGEIGEARECFETASRLATKRGKPPERAAAHFDLALLDEAEGEHASSLRHVTQARCFYQAAGNPAGEAFALNAMGWDHIQLGEPGPAVGYCQQALALYQALGNRHGQTATWDTLGLAQHRLGDHAAAIASFRAALALVGQTGDQHLEGMLMYRLGIACDADGDRDAALAAWHHALDIVKKCGDGDADWTASLRALITVQLSAT